MSDLNLRPHHLLCLRFFEGKGYSADFVRHMYAILEQLEGDPFISLSGGCDDICESCPHLVGGHCESGQKVERYDERVLSHIGLKVSDTLRWRELCDLVDKHILTQRKLGTICCGCQWLYICEKSEIDR